MHWLRHLLPDKTNNMQPPCPAHPICVIGDLHGRADLLERMLSLISAKSGSDTARLVFVGDLIDRGPDSAAVLTRVKQLTEYAPQRVICLMGNHERMLLDFLDNPIKANRWLRHGAIETLASLGVSGHARGETPEARLHALAAELRAALPLGSENWLRALPSYWREGNLAVVHAGADPHLPIDEQSSQTLIWGHRDFLHLPRQDRLWLAYGHTVVPNATAASGRIAVDTGAWQTGRLSAAWLDALGMRFVEVC